MKNILLVITLLGISINCYSGENLQANINLSINQCNTNNNTKFIVYQSESEIMPFINNYDFVVEQLETYYNNDSPIMKELKHIKNSIIKIMDSNRKSNADKNYSTFDKFYQYMDLLNSLEQNNIIPKEVFHEVINNTSDAIKNTRRSLILLDPLEI